MEHASHGVATGSLRRRAFVALSMLGHAACAEPAAPAQVPAPPITVAPESARDGRLVAARASSGPPRGFVLDGAVAEWSHLVDAPLDTKAEAKREPDAPLPMRNAASHVAVALTPSGAIFAGELTGEARDGVWIAFGFSSGSLPVIGNWETGGGTAELVCPEAGETWPRTMYVVTVEAKAECDATLARGAAFAKEWYGRFRRRYLVRENGLRFATATGTSPVPDARVAWKKTATGATLEVEVPALALPLCGEAPVESIALLAAPAVSTSPPVDDASRWHHHEIDPPIGFEPQADHRATLFASARSLSWINGPLAFQPGDPNGIERAGYAPREEHPFTDRETLQVHRSELVRKEATFGDLEVGYIYGSGSAVWRGDVLLGTTEQSTNTWLERDGQMFGVSWSQWINEDSWTDGASFSAFAVMPDGTFRTDLVVTPEPYVPWMIVDEVVPSEDLRVLVIRGVAYGEAIPPTRTTTVTWTYDAKTRDWRPKVTTAPRKLKPNDPR